MNWTKEQLKKGNYSHNFDENKVEKGINKALSPKTKKPNKGKQDIERLLWALDISDFILGYESEYRFHKTRRWRFDWAIPNSKIAIEYEGIISEKSRHTSLKGFSGDCEKYNEAAKLGWKVLRYTALNYKNLHNDLVFLICNK